MIQRYKILTAVHHRYISNQWMMANRANEARAENVSELWVLPYCKYVHYQYSVAIIRDHHPPSAAANKEEKLMVWISLLWEPSVMNLLLIYPNIDAIINNDNVDFIPTDRPDNSPDLVIVLTLITGGKMNLKVRVVLKIINECIRSKTLPPLVLHFLFNFFQV